MSVAPSTSTSALGSRFRRELRFWMGLAAVFAFSTAALLVGWIAFAVFALGWDASLITSGSMTPSIRTGDIVLFDPNIDDPGVRSVVRFPGPDGTAVVHRVAEERREGLVTRGDANASNDSRLLPREDIIGVGVVVVPLIGQPLQWFSTGSWLPLAALSLLGGGGVWLLRGGVLSSDPWSDRERRLPPGFDGPFTAGVLEQGSRHEPFLPDDVIIELRDAGIEFRLERVTERAS